MNNTADQSPFAQTRPPRAPIKVQVCVSDQILEAGLKSCIAVHPEFCLIEGRGEDDEAVPDVIVSGHATGLSLSPMTHKTLGMKDVRIPRVLVITRRDSETDIRYALQSGACGYVIVGCGLDEFIDGLKLVHEGRRFLSRLAASRLAESIPYEFLTKREVEVLRMVVDGCTNKEIARLFNISVGTVKTHMKALFRKLDVGSRLEASRVALRRGLLSYAQPTQEADLAQLARMQTTSSAACNTT